MSNGHSSGIGYVGQSSAPDQLNIIPRQMNFKHVKGKPKHWHHGDPLMTHLLTSASFFFPEGERFFIRSVRHYQNKITDPKLSKEILGFIAQEGIHGNEHEEYNEDVIEQGYTFLKPWKRIIKGLFKVVDRVTSREFQLGMTVSLEHVTALLAGSLLKHPEALLKGCDPKYREIWLWHAVEETEHKSVAFDTYEAIGGRFWIRSVSMVVSNLIFLPTVLIMLVQFLRRDGCLSQQLFRDAMEYHQDNGEVFIEMWTEYKSFFRKDFSPWNNLNQGLVDDWKDSNQTKYSMIEG